MSGRPQRSGFGAVDQESNPQWLCDCLDMQSADPFHQAVRTRVFELLGVGEGYHALDVGCGVGEDARILATHVGASGRVVGVDASATMITQARSRNQSKTLPVEFQQGEASHLPFANEHFDGCFAIRVFQHLADPTAALAEMARVTRTGGRIVVADPDHESVVIAVAEHALVRRFLTWRATTLTNGGAAHQVYGLMKAQGFGDVTVTPLVHLRTDYAATEAVSHYEGGVQVAADEGVFSQEEGDRLVASLHAARDADSFLCSTTFLVACGIRPA